MEPAELIVTVPLVDWSEAKVTLPLVVVISLICLPVPAVMVFAERAPELIVIDTSPPAVSGPKSEAPAAANEIDPAAEAESTLIDAPETLTARFRPPVVP